MVNHGDYLTLKSILRKKISEYLVFLVSDKVYFWPGGGVNNLREHTPFN